MLAGQDQSSVQATVKHYHRHHTIMFQSHNGEKQITQNIRTSQLQVIYLFVTIKV